MKKNLTQVLALLVALAILFFQPTLAQRKGTPGTLKGGRGAKVKTNSDGSVDITGTPVRVNGVAYNGGGDSSPTSSTTPLESFATSGDGAQGNPYNGWEAFTPTNGRSYSFTENKWYIFTTMPNLAITGVSIYANGAHLKKASAGGICLPYNGGAYNTLLADAKIDCNGASVGLHIDSLFHSQFRNVYLYNVADTGIELAWLVLSTMDNVRITNQEGPNGLCCGGVPTLGISTTHSGSDVGKTVQANTFNQVYIQGAGQGAQLRYFVNNTILSSSFENLTGLAGAVLCDATCTNNTIIGHDDESNAGGVDWYILGQRNTFVGLENQGQFHIAAGGNNNKIIGGRFYQLWIEAAALNNTIDGATVTLTSGGLADFSPSTHYVSPVFNAGSGTYYAGQMNFGTGYMRGSAPDTVQARNALNNSVGFLDGYAYKLQDHIAVSGGAGPPSGACTPGIYINFAPGASPALYGCDGGVWVGK